MPTIEVVQGDIFEQKVDAIVNPANELMIHGGGLASVIAKKGGKSIWTESAKHAPVPTGNAIMTGPGDLPFKKVIHAVGPVWGAKSPKESDDLLYEAHRNALVAADMLDLRSVAFPAISCGIFGYPVKRAAPIAIRAARSGVRERVVFVLPQKKEYKAYKRALRPWYLRWLP